METSSSSQTNNLKVTSNDEMSEMGDAEEQSVSSSSTASTYEGVTATQFDEAIAEVDIKMDALLAASAVMVVALFACIAVIAVQTLIRSLER